MVTYAKAVIRDVEMDSPFMVLCEEMKPCERKDLEAPADNIERR
jgi:hypothetical protein